MSTSLTRDEFLKRLVERNEQFELSIKNGLKQVDANIKVRYESPNNIYIELSEFIGTIASDVILRAVDIVYQDQ